MKKRNAGFTLMELMIVVGILSIIAAITVPNLLSSRKRSQEGAAVATLRSIGTAQMSFLTAAELTTAGGSPHYGSFTELAGSNKSKTQYLDGTWAVAANQTRGAYTYVVTASTATPVVFQATALADDTTKQKSFLTNEGGSIVGKLGGLPAGDGSDGEIIQ